MQGVVIRLYLMKPGKFWKFFGGRGNTTDSLITKGYICLCTSAQYKQNFACVDFKSTLGKFPNSRLHFLAQSSSP